MYMEFDFLIRDQILFDKTVQLMMSYLVLVQAEDIMGLCPWVMGVVYWLLCFGR